MADDARAAPAGAIDVHDLLRLSDPAAVAASDLPDWVRPALDAAPWVVARRARAAPGRVAVGVRGEGRERRFACEAPLGAVAETLSPEALARRVAKGLGAAGVHPVLDALAALAPALDAEGFDWGPVGAVGFALASGRSALTASSDLDLVVRALRPPDAARLTGLAAILRSAPVRVDALIETPQGGFALAEWTRGAAEILLRTPDGPRLVSRARLAGPWPGGWEG